MAVVVVAVWLPKHIVPTRPINNPACTEQPGCLADLRMGASAVANRPCETCHQVRGSSGTPRSMGGGPFWMNPAIEHHHCPGHFSQASTHNAITVCACMWPHSASSSSNQSTFCGSSCGGPPHRPHIPFLSVSPVFRPSASTAIVYAYHRTSSTPCFPSAPDSLVCVICKD